jgi:hypothetical protein
MARRMTKQHEETLKEIVGAYPRNIIIRQIDKMAAATAKKRRPPNYEGNIYRVWLCVEIWRAAHGHHRRLSVREVCNRMSREMKKRNLPVILSGDRLRGIYYECEKKLRDDLASTIANKVALPGLIENEIRRLADSRAAGRKYSGILPVLEKGLPEWAKGGQIAPDVADRIMGIASRWEPHGDSGADRLDDFDAVMLFDVIVRESAAKLGREPTVNEIANLASGVRTHIIMMIIMAIVADLNERPASASP